MRMKPLKVRQLTKKEFLNFIFANLSLRGENLDYSLAFPFDKPQEVVSFLELAERGGFEPPTRVAVNTLSRRAP